MKRSLMVLLLGGALSAPVWAESPEDVLLQKLEASGKLDAAVDRALERRIAKEKQQREAEEKSQQQLANEAAKKIHPLGKGDRIYGSENAKVSIIVMSDPECPYCQRFGGVPEKAVDQLQGLANAAVRLFPLDFHGQKALDASLAALCVADQAGVRGYYAFYDGYLAATQGNGRGIPDGKGKRSAANVLGKLLKAAGVTDSGKFKACQQAGETRQRLEAEFNAAVEAGTNGTPYVVLRNNESGEVRVAGGMVPVEALVEAVRAMADRKK